MKIKASIIYILLWSLFIGHSFAQCNDEHSNDEESHWLSCQIAENPNSERANSHWILYDLGFEYTLSTSTIWNYNVENETGKGFKNVVIDYSLDGINWTELGEYEFSEATGTNNYEGFDGPDFTNNKMRYVLITAYDTWTANSCAGLAEVKFNIKQNTTNVNESIDSYGVSIYPNPVTDIMTLSLDNIQITKFKIISIDGKIYNASIVTNKLPYIDVSYLPSGNYILQIIGENKIVTRQFVKI